jgi:hypothetical protein
MGLWYATLTVTQNSNLLVGPIDRDKRMSEEEYYISGGYISTQ